MIESRNRTHRLIPRDGNLVLPFVFFTLFFTLFYGTTSRLQLMPPTVIVPSAIDQLFPLLPATILIYMTQFMMLPISMILAKDEIVRARAYAAMLIAVFVSAAVFLAFPTRLPRDLSVIQSGPFSQLWDFLYAVDTDSNCLPSLHVSLALLSYWAVRRRSNWIRLPIATWSVAIVISTMTTKQHLFADVVGGVCVAVGAAWISERRLRFRDTSNT